ncbi:ABC transporter permease [Staphylococcus hominis]|uniref:ABC transporter permease n=1 Tax=Staphylococcus hominis TaxID=1290 RepID=UPI0008FB8E31|nr:ABC transporter permease [Staphylococcus hominis]SIK12995.1 multidrug ABC transporter permease [Mycobacteroides abscessus subsp. abscessus]KAF1677720.1 ABC transporter permease [Staphylococcus hominis]MCI3135740.1 ABC transporter permease [Staphylococcus hominis subsp. hominis]MDS3873736.1 ABC transporter permease [Staphylococcus hominis]OIS43645.1 ABC transporter permease [Staphylococcus hominis]
MKLLAMIQRVIIELLKDKRTLALMFLAPLLVLTLMYFIFNSDEDTTLTIGVDHSVSTQITEGIKSDDVKFKDFPSNQHIKSKIEHHHLDAFIYQNNQTIHVTYTNEDPSKSASIKQLLHQSIQKDKMNDIKKVMVSLPQSAKNKDAKDIQLENTYLYGDEHSNYFDKMFPILMSFFVFLFVFLISGIALLRERTTGTLERVLATPIKRSEIVFGYLIGYGVFAIIQTLIIVFFSIYLLNINLAGSLTYVILINILLAIAALVMGIFISTFANSEFQMVQFIPIVAIPQVFFSGIFPLENMSPWLSNIGYLFPLRYAGHALTNIMIKGQGWSNIWFDVLILFVFIIIFTTMNMIGLKRYRKV